MGYKFHRIDQNQKKIVKRFRELGCVVAITSSVGYGFPDLVCRHPWSDKILMIEIKDGDKPPSAQKLTPAEMKFHDDWAGCVYIIKSEAEAGDLVMRVLGIC